MIPLQGMQKLCGVPFSYKNECPTGIFITVTFRKYKTSIKIVEIDYVTGMRKFLFHS